MPTMYSEHLSRPPKSPVYKDASSGHTKEVWCLAVELWGVGLAPQACRTWENRVDFWVWSVRKRKNSSVWQEQSGLLGLSAHSHCRTKGL